VDFQGTLFDSGRAQVPALDGVERRPLTRGAWVDVRRNWLPGADEVLASLVRDVPWRAERRQMYDREVDVPRLLRFYGEDDPLPHPLLDEARRLLSEHYGPELGEPFRTAGLCFYRDGRDSVAWHGDRIGRGNTHDTMVAIIVLGAPRALLLRPRGGGGPSAGRCTSGSSTCRGCCASTASTSRCPIPRWAR